MVDICCNESIGIADHIIDCKLSSRESSVDETSEQPAIGVKDKAKNSPGSCVQGLSKIPKGFNIHSPEL